MFLFFLNIVESAKNLAALTAVDTSQPTWDLFIYLFFVVIVLLFALTLGRQRVVSILISTYLALAVINALPYLEKAWGDLTLNLGIFAIKVSSFGVIFLVTFFILSRSAVLHEITGPSRGIISSLIFTFLFVGLLTSIVLGFLPKEYTSVISLFTKNLFISDLARFVWVVAPILALGIFRGKRQD